MGISWDEMNRIHDSHSRAYTFEYPLVDAKLTRGDCKRIIQEHGWPVPPKSGCWYCPFQKAAGWKDLYVKHPDLFKRARDMEESQQHYPKYVLSGTGKPLKKLAVRFGEGSTKLDLFVEEETCEQGFCLV